MQNSTKSTFPLVDASVCQGTYVVQASELLGSTGYMHYYYIVLAQYVLVFSLKILELTTLVWFGLLLAWSKLVDGSE